MDTRRFRLWTRPGLPAVVALLVLVLGVVAGPRAHAASTGSTYVPLTPTRLLDTRTAGPGGTDAPLGVSATRAVTIAGQGGVPSDVSQVTAVVLNLTVVNA